MTEKLEKYLAQLKEKGQKVPGIRYSGKPHFRLISVASGVDYKFLTAEPARRRISIAAEALGIVVKRYPAKLLSEELFEQNCSVVAYYLKWLEAHGLTLPENPTHRGEIFFRQAEIESGLDPNTLGIKDAEVINSSGSRLREMFQASVPRLGLAVRILPQSPGHAVTPITYERLLERGTEERKLELKGKSSSDQQLYNTRSALRSFCKALNLGVAAEVGVEFVANFKNSLNKVISQLRTTGVTERDRKLPDGDLQAAFQRDRE